MKKLFILLSLFFIIPAYGQVSEQCQFWDINHNTNSIMRYKLYPTFNRYNFLKLDTQTGRVTIVQYDVQGDNEFEYFLDIVRPYIPDSLQVVGRFELYPTRNNYTFIMLDQIDGQAYHVQWSTERDKRFIKEIYYTFGQ